MEITSRVDPAKEGAKSDSSSQLDIVFRYAYRNKDKLAPGSEEMSQLSQLMEGLKSSDFGLEDPTSTPRSTKATTECSHKMEFKQSVGKRKSQTAEDEARHKKPFSAGCKHMQPLESMETKKTSEPYIGCRTVYGDKDLVMAIFLLPKGVAMPIHDHPGMTVASKLLYGMVEVEEYDWVNKSKKLCRKYSEKGDANEIKVHAIGAEYCNIHTFKAITDSAILDIITPPYDPTTRSPAFFKVHPTKNGMYKMEQYMPSEFRCFEEPYLGPKVDIPKDLLKMNSDMQIEK
mmetsp:Transcript_4667/g.6192  ORF Transcript_4667/g.6192 Transcript_4667/m.6192 type:complete len:288 (-) Transcript_4667:182-1045(-)